jgi:hypothetical protein
MKRLSEMRAIGQEPEKTAKTGDKNVASGHFPATVQKSAFKWEIVPLLCPRWRGPLLVFA